MNFCPGICSFEGYLNKLINTLLRFGFCLILTFLDKAHFVIKRFLLGLFILPFQSTIIIAFIASCFHIFINLILSVAHLEVADLFRLDISLFCSVSVSSHYTVMFLSLCWTKSSHTTYPLIKGLLPPSIESNQLKNVTSEISGFSVHAATPC